MNFNRNRIFDLLFKNLSLLASIIIIVISVGIFLTLFEESLPAMKEFGLRFLYGSDWVPNIDKFGALTPIIGTISVSVLALLMAIPISISTAFFITHITPKRYRNFFSISSDLLSAIPSVIYGMIGLFYLAPIIYSFSENGGLGILTASLILSLMISPIIISFTRDAIYSVPKILQESAYALGATKVEVIFNIIIPKIKFNIFNAIILAFSRAFGETMAVTFVIGNSHILPTSIFSSGSTIASTMANEFLEASSDLHHSSLMFLSLILFLISFTMILLSRRVLEGKHHG